MTREEALAQLRLGPGINEDVSEEYNEAVDMAIKAIKTIPSENEKIIKVSKGTLKVRTGRYVIYDVEWLKEHFNTTEAKIYGQPSEDCISRKAVLDGLASIAKAKAKSDAQKSLMGRVMFFTEHLPSVTPQPETEGARGDIPLQQSVPKMPQPSEHTEERTETHECDCISRKAAIDALKQQAENMLCWSERYTEQRKGILTAINIVSDLLSVTPQSKEEPQQKTGHWIGHREHCEKLGVIPSGLGVYEWCSNCGHGIDIRDWSRISHNYCPKCGAKMQEVKK